ncbi:MAG: zinc ribbon domain-containing protein [Ruminococcaceae bacterium]|nr:zinc ribbon domain-containing protein [Oscillospiraceae bacterium]
MNRVPLYCHKCGTEIRPGQEYCISCGSSAREAVAAAQQRTANPYAGASHVPCSVQNQPYTAPNAYSQPQAQYADVSELSRKIDILQNNQAIMMKNMENTLRKYAKKRSTCIVVLGVLLGVFILACIILVCAVIFLSSDTVKTVVDIIDEFYVLLKTYGSQLESLIAMMRDYL